MSWTEGRRSDRDRIVEGKHFSIQGQRSCLGCSKSLEATPVESGEDRGQASLTASCSVKSNPLQRETALVFMSSEGHCKLAGMRDDAPGTFHSAAK